MSAIGQAYELEQVLSRLYKAEAWLADDIGRTFPIRLFREARRVGAEPVLEALFTGLDKALRAETRLPEVMMRFDKAFERALRPQARHGAALKVLEKQRARWVEIRGSLLRNDAKGTEELVAWLDRDIEERMAIARSFERGSPRGGAVAGKVSSASAQGLKQGQRVAAAARAKQSREVYEAFVSAAAQSKPDDFLTYNKLAAYFRHDDPVWSRLAEKVAGHRMGKDTDDVAQAIQGVIGEALALRNAWVVDSIVSATERAHRIAAKLGTEWEVVLTQAPVFATTRTGGMGEIYDASIWVARKGAAGETLDAAPVLVLQVKSGTTKTAAQQIGKDFGRELVGQVRLPAGGVGTGATRTYRLNNLRKLLAANGIQEPVGIVGSLTTQRILVAPRAPTTKSILDNLPKGTTIEFVEGLMTKRELNTISEAMRDELKRSRKR